MTPPARGGRVRRRRLVAAVLLAWLAFLVVVPVYAWSSVTRVNSTPAGERPPGGGGSNYLLVGSDSRAGLTDAEQAALSTGPDEGGQRTDSIIVVHHSSSGPSSMISLPRDSYVMIPGYGRDKLNAAYAVGGPELLVATVEGATGLRIDGYLEIGFGGFAGVVDALGGVDICVPFPMQDERAGIDLAPGCQELDGAQALGFVRSRYTDPRGDIGRAERQRQFLGAIIAKAASPWTVALPWRYYAFSTASARGLSVGEDTSLYEAGQILLTMRGVSNGSGLSLVVPIEDPAYQTEAGTAVKWDTERALALFAALARDDALTAPPPGTDGIPSGGQ